MTRFHSGSKVRANACREAKVGREILISKNEAAHLLSVSLRTVDALIRRMELPCRRIGRRVLIPRSAIERFAEAEQLPNNTGRNNVAE